MIKLDYSDLISKEPYVINNVCSVISPTLSQVFKKTYYTYCAMVNYLRITPQDYFEELEKVGAKINQEDVLKVTKFDLLLLDQKLRENVTDALNFFLAENVIFDVENFQFITYTVDENDETKIFGYINKDNYSDVTTVIIQRLHIQLDENEIDDISKVKNKRGLKIFEKIMKGRKSFKKSKEESSGSTNTMANIISAVAAFSPNLNYLQIWDLTVYQLYDLFNRLNIIDQYNIASTTISVWGDKEKKFKTGLWYENIYKN